MNVYLTAVSVLALFLQTSICSRYPTVENPYHLNVRLLHLASNRYISVTRDEKGEFQLNTKPFAQIADPDVDFSLYLYSVSEAEEIKVAIVIHQASSSYLSMGSQNDLQLLPMISDNAEELFSFDNPSLISVADTRFFYLRKYKHAYALNFLRDSNYYLAVNKFNQTVLKKFVGDGHSYPNDVLFTIEFTED